MEWNGWHGLDKGRGVRLLTRLCPIDVPGLVLVDSELPRLTSLLEESVVAVVAWNLPDGPHRRSSEAKFFARLNDLRVAVVEVPYCDRIDELGPDLPFLSALKAIESAVAEYSLKCGSL